MKALEKYSSFTCKHSLETDGRIILLDESLDQEVRVALKALKTVDNQELLFLEGSQLAENLEDILIGIIKRERDILFVFPGNGSNYPRKLSRVCQKFAGASVYAKRFWQPGTDPIVTVGDIILSDISFATTVKTVLVVDDVISSGLTMQKVHQNNAWRFTEARWVGASWVSQIPRMKAKSGVNGYEYVTTACMVGKINGGKVPINSISTLRQQQEIAKSYAQRHFEKPEEFLHLIGY